MTNLNQEDILIVEDDVLLGQILLDQFKKSGFNAELLTSGEEVINSLQNKLPDLLLLDIFLPSMNGLDILQIIRNDDQLKNLKVIIASNTDQIDSRNRAEELGSSFISKSTTTPDLIIDFVKKELAK